MIDYGYQVLSSDFPLCHICGHQPDVYGERFISVTALRTHVNHEGKSGASLPLSVLQE
jgi:hypothetical protein